MGIRERSDRGGGGVSVCGKLRRGSEVRGKGRGESGEREGKREGEGIKA
ncbi:hypothetical protein [Escherichia coli]|nr:hypothetical protein [Escherichia coli]